MPLVGKSDGDRAVAHYKQATRYDKENKHAKSRAGLPFVRHARSKKNRPMSSRVIESCLRTTRCAIRRYTRLPVLEVEPVSLESVDPATTRRWVARYNECVHLPHKQNDKKRPDYDRLMAFFWFVLHHKTRRTPPPKKNKTETPFFRVILVHHRGLLIRPGLCYTIRHRLYRALVLFAWGA